MIWSLHNVALLGQGFSRFVMVFFWCCRFSIVLLRSACGRSLWFGAIKWHQVALSMNLRILEVLQYNDSTSCFMLHLFRAVSWTLEPLTGTHTKLITTNRHPPAKCLHCPLQGFVELRQVLPSAAPCPWSKVGQEAARPARWLIKGPNACACSAWSLLFQSFPFLPKKNGPNLHAL